MCKNGAVLGVEHVDRHCESEEQISQYTSSQIRRYAVCGRKERVVARGGREGEWLKGQGGILREKESAGDEWDDSIACMCVYCLCASACSL